MVSVATVEGRTVYEHSPAIEVRRRGRTRKGRRIASARMVEKQIVPKIVVVAWVTAARMTAWDEGAGMERRWKYHWETVAAVVAR